MSQSEGSRKRRKGRAAQRLNARKGDRIVITVKQRGVLPLPPGMDWRFEKDGGKPPDST